jgi:surface protein
MAIRTLTNSGINNTNISSKAFPAGFIPVTEPWVRNPSWLTISAEVGDNRVQGLYAVFPGDGVGNGGNFFALAGSGAYTIDFGDGTVTNYANGVNAYYEYDYNNAALDGTNAPVTLTDSGDLVTRTAHGYSDGMIVSFYNITTTTGIVEAQHYYVINSTANTFQISATESGSAIALTNDGSATLLPYKIAVVTITPQAGQNLTNLNLFKKHNGGLFDGYSTGWLDIAIALPSCTFLTIGSPSGTVRYLNLEQVTINQLGNITSLYHLFGGCHSLRNVDINYSVTSSVTTMQYMFRYCYSLTSVPLFDTSNVTNISYMLQRASALTSVPLFDTSNVTNMTGFLRDCYSLTSVPLFDTSSVTTMSNMFLSCYSLTSVPLFDTSSVTSMSNMLTACYSLTSVPLFNTSSVTDMNSMFNGCYILTSVPLFDTSSVTTATYMFSSCSSLTSVPLFDTSSLLYMSNMFNSCYSLTSVPLLNTSSVVFMNYMFQNCHSLTSVPLFVTSSVTNMSYMLQNCYSLTSVPALAVSSVSSSSNFNNMFSNCNSLSRVEATGFNYTFSVANNKLSSAALDEIYTNLPTVTGQTITVTGNYGTSGDDPTIATAKGWTVTG